MVNLQRLVNIIDLPDALINCFQLCLSRKSDRESFSGKLCSNPDNNPSSELRMAGNTPSSRVKKAMRQQCFTHMANIASTIKCYPRTRNPLELTSVEMPFSYISRSNSLCRSVAGALTNQFLCCTPNISFFLLYNVRCISRVPQTISHSSRFLYVFGKAVAPG